MRLTTMTDYALRLLMYVGQRPDRLCTISEVAAAPADINLGEVVRSIEPDFSLVDCLTTAKSCTLTGSCRLTGIVSDALQSFMAHLDRHSLADLLPPPPVAGSARQRPVTFGKRASPTARG